jgi:hypothetical protein
MPMDFSTRVWIATSDECLRWRILGSGRAEARTLPILRLEPIAGRVRASARPKPHARQVLLTEGCKPKSA